MTHFFSPDLPLVDARGLSCPMPLLKAKLALNGCERGEHIRVLATDAGSVRDFHSFAELSAHSLVLFSEHAEAPPSYFEYILQKGPLA
ncbi:MAG: sulfurtransferase TusA family protein [Marinagarivorans sp.]|nr:sulfurtransferase TusA family protein [Marinagarivorans sp.]